MLTCDIFKKSVRFYVDFNRYSFDRTDLIYTMAKGTWTVKWEKVSTSDTAGVWRTTKFRKLNGLVYSD